MQFVGVNTDQPGAAAKARKLLEKKGRNDDDTWTSITVNNGSVQHLDFLDDDDEPVFRVYYQDAPTNAPIGNPPATILADKRVDVALLCVGTYDQVAAQPEEIAEVIAFLASDKSGYVTTEELQAYLHRQKP